MKKEGVELGSKQTTMLNWRSLCQSIGEFGGGWEIVHQGRQSCIGWRWVVLAPQALLKLSAAGCPQQDDNYIALVSHWLGAARIMCHWTKSRDRSANHIPSRRASNSFLKEDLSSAFLCLPRVTYLSLFFSPPNFLQSCIAKARCSFLLIPSSHSWLQVFESEPAQEKRGFYDSGLKLWEGQK